ncbi:hypothetical protein ACSNN5_27305 [Brevibacillus formosus]
MQKGIPLRELLTADPWESLFYEASILAAKEEEQKKQENLGE